MTGTMVATTGAAAPFLFFAVLVIRFLAMRDWPCCPLPPPQSSSSTQGSWNALELTSACLDTHERRLFTGYTDGSICCWNLSNGDMVRRFDTHTRHLTCIAYHRHGTSHAIVAGSWSGYVVMRRDRGGALNEPFVTTAPAMGRGKDPHRPVTAPSSSPLAKAKSPRASLAHSRLRARGSSPDSAAAARARSATPHGGERGVGVGLAATAGTAATSAAAGAVVRAGTADSTRTASPNGNRSSSRSRSPGYEPGNNNASPSGSRSPSLKSATTPRRWPGALPSGSPIALSLTSGDRAGVAPSGGGAASARVGTAAASTATARNDDDDDVCVLKCGHANDGGDGATAVQVVGVDRLTYGAAGRPATAASTAAATTTLTTTTTSTAVRLPMGADVLCVVTGCSGVRESVISLPWMVSGQMDGQVIVWNATSGQPVSRFVLTEPAVSTKAATSAVHAANTSQPCSVRQHACASCVGGGGNFGAGWHHWP